MGQGYATRQLYDQQRHQLNAGVAAMAMASAALGEATLALDATRHTVELDCIKIADTTLVAPSSRSPNPSCSGAGLSVVWPQFAAVSIAGALFLTIAVVHFRRVAGQTE